MDLFGLMFAARMMSAHLATLTDERIELADAIAVAVDEDAPLFHNDVDKLRTLAEHIAVAYRESGLRTDAVGDHGRSFCAFQIHTSSGGKEALTKDPLACARAGHALLRQSHRVCRAFPIAWYAEGPRGCESPRAQRISRDRLALAASLLR